MGHDGLLRIITESETKTWFRETKPGADDMKSVSEDIFFFLLEMAKLYSSDAPPVLISSSAPEITERENLRIAGEYAKTNGLLTTLPSWEARLREARKYGLKFLKKVKIGPFGFHIISDAPRSPDYSKVTSGIMLEIKPGDKVVLYLEYAMRCLDGKIDDAIGKLIRYGYRFQPCDGYSGRPDITSKAELAKRRA